MTRNNKHKTLEFSANKYFIIISNITCFINAEHITLPLMSTNTFKDQTFAFFSSR